MADLGNFFFQNVMAANIIENFKNFEIFLLFQGEKQYLPKYWTENRENQSGIYFKAILSVGVKFSWKNTKIKKNIFLPKQWWFDI